MNLCHYDDTIRQQGFPVLCGVDEAGRGPLAGPVCAAAVILSPECVPDGINDSKKLGETKREELFEQITRFAVSWAIAWASVEEIEQLNILHASMLAMKRAVEQLSTMPALVLIDGNRVPELQIQARPVVKGDTVSASIAAASILAKVSRDRFMRSLDLKYPDYGFAGHKGYPTKLHYQKIDEFGVSPVHRLSFLKKHLRSGS